MRWVLAVKVAESSQLAETRRLAEEARRAVSKPPLPETLRLAEEARRAVSKPPLPAALPPQGPRRSRRFEATFSTDVLDRPPRPLVQVSLQA